MVLFYTFYGLWPPSFANETRNCFGRVSPPSPSSPRISLPSWTPAATLPPASDPRESAHECVLAEKTCFVRRVCTEDGSTWKYFVGRRGEGNSSTIVPPVLATESRQRTGGESLGFVAVAGVPPSRNEAHWIDGITAIVRSAVPHNAGHIVGDDIFPVFYALLEFGVLGGSAPVTVVESGMSGMSALHTKLFEQWHAITDKPVLLLRKLAEQAKADGMPLCFESIVSGFKTLGYSNRNFDGKGALWLIYRQWILERWGLNSSAVIGTRGAKQRIVLLEKSNQRHIVNKDQLLLDLRSEFPEADVGLVVWDKMPMKDQIQVASQAWVLIGVPGTTIYNSYLIQPGGCVVTLCQVLSEGPNCGNEKEILWDHFAHVRLRDYKQYDPEDLKWHPEVLDDMQKDQREAILSGKNVAYKKFWQYWGSTDVFIRKERLIPLVKQCLTEPF